jgi:hypothetical protein
MKALCTAIFWTLIRLRDMKRGLIGKHDVCLCQFGQACHRQNCVAMGCPLVSTPTESAPYTHRDTTTFREPYKQLVVASAVPIKPKDLTSLDFR